MINKKGLTDKEINKLIDKDIEWQKEFETYHLPQIARVMTTQLLIKLIKEGEIRVDGDKITWLKK